MFYCACPKGDINAAGVHTTDSPFHFAMFVLRHNLVQNYNDVLESFKGSEIISLLPDNQIRFWATLAVIVADSGKKQEARNYAVKVLELLQSGGADENSIPPELRRKVAELAGG